MASVREQCNRVNSRKGISPGDLPYHASCVVGSSLMKFSFKTTRGKLDEGLMRLIPRLEAVDFDRLGIEFQTFLLVD